MLQRQETMVAINGLIVSTERARVADPLVPLSFFRYIDTSILSE